MLLLLLIFILVPIAELYVIIKIGGAIGILPTSRCSSRTRSSDPSSFASRAAPPGCASTGPGGEPFPHKEVFDGVLIVFGGALLLTPGFITDVFGLVLLIPPTRRW